MSYFKHPFISSTTIKTICSNLDNHREAIRCIREPFEGNTATRLGSAFHDKVLLGDEYFFDHWFIYNENERPDPTKTMSAKTNKEWKAEILASVPDGEMLKAAEYDEILELESKLLLPHPALSLLDTSKPDNCEVEFYADKLRFKCKCDYINVEKGYIIDLKTTKETTLKGVEYAIKSFHLEVQAKHYINVLKSITGKDFKFIFFFATKRGLHTVMLSPTTLERAQLKIDEALNIINKYKDSKLADIPGFDLYFKDNKGVQII